MSNLINKSDPAWMIPGAVSMGGLFPPQVTHVVASMISLECQDMAKILNMPQIFNPAAHILSPFQTGKLALRLSMSGYSFAQCAIMHLLPCQGL